MHTFQDKHGVTPEKDSKTVLDPWGSTLKTYRRVALPLQVGRNQLEIMQGTPLHFATMNGNAVAVEALLRFGSDAEITTGAYADYTDAYFENSTSVTFKHLTLDRSKWKTALHIVPEIRKGGGHIAEILVKHGAANIEVQDYKGWTPLIGAAVMGNLEVVEALIELGCDMDTMPDINQTKDHVQFAFWTALRHAVVNKRDDVIVALMREGADPNCIATDAGKLTSHVKSDFDINACYFLQNKATPGTAGPHQDAITSEFAAHFKDDDSHACLKNAYSPDEFESTEISTTMKKDFEGTKKRWIETRKNKSVANLMATMKRLRKKQTTMLPSEMLSDYEQNGSLKLDMDDHVKNLQNIGTSACLPWFLRNSTGKADTIAEALLTSTFDHSMRTRETPLYSTNLLTLSDSFYVAVRCDEPGLADLIFKYAWTMRSASEAKRAKERAKERKSTAPNGELLEKFKCWKLLLMILKDRVFDRESSFMVRACECRNNEMVTTISALRTLVRSDLAIAASSITKVLNDKLSKLRDKRSDTQSENLSQKISKYKHTDAHYDYRHLKELVEHCEKDETKEHTTRHWPRALVDVDDDKAYHTMSYGRLQEGLDIIVSCQGLVEEFVFNFEAPPGSLNAFSPLHHTCNAEEEMIESVQTLAKAKVNVNAKGKYGLTPLHIACLRGHVRVVEELLAYNANSAQFTRLENGCTFPHTGSDIIMNTLKIYPEAVERVTALQMAVHPRHFFSATVSAVQVETGAQLAQHGDAIGSDHENAKAIAERIVYNLGLGDYIRLAKISAAEAFNLAKHGAYERVKELNKFDSASLKKEIECACDQQYNWTRWHNSSGTLHEPKVDDEEKVRRLLGLGLYSLKRDNLGPVLERFINGRTQRETLMHTKEHHRSGDDLKGTRDEEEIPTAEYALCLQGLCMFEKDHMDKCKIWSFRGTTDDKYLMSQEAVAKMKPAIDYVAKEARNVVKELKAEVLEKEKAAAAFTVKQILADNTTNKTLYTTDTLGMDSTVELETVLGTLKTGLRKGGKNHERCAWTAAEDAKITELKGINMQWSHLAKSGFEGNRTEDQCRDRWLDYLVTRKIVLSEVKSRLNVDDNDQLTATLSRTRTVGDVIKVMTDEMCGALATREAWRKVKMFAMHGAINAVLQRALKTPKCHLNIVKQLVERGDSKEYTNDAGQNALHLAYLNLKFDEDERAAQPDMTRGPHDPEEVEDKDGYSKAQILQDDINREHANTGDANSTATLRAKLKIKKLKGELAEAEEDEEPEGGDLKFGLLSGPATEIIRFLQRETNLDALEEVLDKDLNPPFTKPQREEFYLMVQNEMDRKPDWRNPLYKEPRAQSAVKFKWGKEVWNIKCCTLILYLIFFITVLVIFMNHFGNHTASMVRGVEEVLVNDEWDSVDSGPNIGGHSGANGFLDIVNVDEYWMWLENVALGAVFSDPKPYRDSKGKLRMSMPGSFSPNVYPIGRPRLRQIRVNESSCKSGGKHGKLKASGVMSEHYANISNDTCFYRENIATANFTAGGKTFVHQKKLGPRAHPFVGSWGKLQGDRVYSGGGYSWNIPTNKTLAMEEFQSMKDGHWIDLNTMAVFFEFGLYNANSNMFMVGRMALEMDQMGMIATHHDFKTMKLELDSEWTSYGFHFFEVLYVLQVIYWMWEEVRQCCPCCRSRTGVEIEKMRRKGDVDPMNNANGCCTKTACFIACCTKCCTRCCRGKDEAELAALNASAYFSLGYDILDMIIYALHILFMGLRSYVTHRTVPINGIVNCPSNHSICGNTPDTNFTITWIAAHVPPMFVPFQQPEDFVAVMFETALIVEMQKIVVSIVLFCMVWKSAEHFIINDLYAK